MAEYIEREAAIKATQFDDPDGYDLRVWRSSIAIDMKNRISKIPAADVAPVRHAMWVFSSGDYPYCSDCGCESLSRVKRPYCQFCGALMDGNGR